MARGSLRADVSGSVNTGASADASTVGKTQYGYSPMPVGSSAGSAEVHATTLIVAILVELAAYAFLRHLFRDVLGG